LNQVNTTNCIEKIDYQRAAAARLFLRCRHFPVNYPYKTILPQWVLSMSPAKLSYYFNISESRRRNILVNEVCAINWMFYFKRSEDESGFQCRYFLDFSMQSQLHGGFMRWPFLEYDVVEGGSQLQVEQYPPLHFSRLPTGEWQMENNYVRMVQIGYLSPTPELPSTHPLL